MRNYLLDSFAILSWLQDEEGAEIIERILQDGQDRRSIVWVNIINIGEVYYRIAKVRDVHQADQILEKIKLLPIKIVSCNDELVIKAAKIKAKYPVAYADAFAIATAIDIQATIISNDPELYAVKQIVNVEWI